MKILHFIRKYFFLLVLIIVLVFLGFIAAINIYVLSFSKTNLYTQVDELPKNEVWLVFGASVIQNKYPSDILKDRLKVAAKAYKQWKIHQIIVSGDNRNKNYNEPVVMQKFLIAQWVDVDHIHLDYAGFDTYDSLYRAKELFKVDSLTLFTQDFHLKRALYISSRLGIQSTGISTNLQLYIKQDYNNKREFFARVKAFLDVELLKSKPKFLWDDLKIYPLEEIENIKKQLSD